MEFMDGLKELWLQYYPMILAGMTTVGIAITGIVVLWGQIKPMWESISQIKEKLFGDKEKAKEAISEQLKIIELDNQICDLREKINNPLISENSRQIYTKNLELLVQMKTKLENGLVKVEEETNKYL